MTDPLHVFLAIVSVLLVIGVGWTARRVMVLSDNATRSLSHFVIDFAMPALILNHMTKSVDVELLQRSWYFPLVGAGVVLVGAIPGVLLAAPLSDGSSRRTFAFLVGATNWFYLPLVLVETLVTGAERKLLIDAILLFNLGIMPLLWTLGVWALRGGGLERERLRELVRNPGLIATVVGILLAVFVPSVQQLHATPDHGAPLWLLAGSSVVRALAMLAQIALPLSLIAIGAQLAGMHSESRAPLRTTLGVVGGRLLAAPLAVAGVLWVLRQAGWELAPEAQLVGVLVAAMPVALNASLFTQRFGGDVGLAARTVAWSTVASVFSVPAIMALWQLQ